MLRKTGSRVLKLVQDPKAIAETPVEEAPANGKAAQRRGWEDNGSSNSPRPIQVWELWCSTMRELCPEAAIALPARPSTQWHKVRSLRESYNLGQIEKMFRLAMLDWPAIRSRYRFVEREYPDLNIVFVLRDELMVLALTGRGVVSAVHRVSRFAEDECRRLHKTANKETKKKKREAPEKPPSSGGYERWHDV